MTEDYQARLSAQKQQYKRGEEIHDLPPIFHYWSNKYLRPKLEAVFGVSTVCDFYGKPFSELFHFNRGMLRFVSIGSGDCAYEVELCEYLLSRNLTNFIFVCTEVNEQLISQARERIQQACVGQWLQVDYFDINRDGLDVPVDAFMAHHSLHHVVELERLFSMMDRCLLPHGRFLTQDMIGRNGHMRWPESLAFVNALWGVIDGQKKFNHQFKVQYDNFVNFDCSKEGFEGIRAQDILPLLSSTFSFGRFIGTGGIIEIFVDRGYGHNYSTADERDLEFVDFVAELNDRLIELGLIKPTIMFAEMGKKGKLVEAKLYKGISPEFCIRPLPLEAPRLE